MGKFGGSLRDLPVFRLGAVVIREAISRAGVKPEEVDDVILGSCRQAGNGTNPVRTAARLASLPAGVPALTVTMACASGMRAVMMAAQALQLGDGRLIVAGGMESMSTIPYLLMDGRWEGFRRGDKRLVDGWYDSRDPFIDDLGTGVTTERLIEKHGISRAEQDRFAFESHRKAAQAREAGLFDEEVVPVETQSGDEAPRLLLADETIRADTSLYKLSQLPTTFKEGGSLTAGNSSSLTDGAAALVLTTRDVASVTGQRPLFSIVSQASGAVENAFMGEGPSIVLPKALKAAGLGIHDLDYLEVNEAFAGMVLANERLLHWDREKLNVKGGAIALGHPVGCSGARILVTLYHILKHRDAEIGGATIGAAGGVCTAMVIKRES
jgi:acetyl-CoA C-acetyltransferase